MQVISEMKAHGGAIKCVKAMPMNAGDCIFATAGDISDKCIHIWD